MNENAKILMFEFWKVDFSIRSKTSVRKCSEYFVIERFYVFDVHLKIEIILKVFEKYVVNRDNYNVDDKWNKLHNIC